MNLQIFPKEFFQKFSIPYIYISGRRNGQRSRNLLLNSALRKIGQKETEKGQTQAGRRIPGGFSGQGPPARSGSSSPPPPDRPGGKTGGQRKRNREADWKRSSESEVKRGRRRDEAGREAAESQRPPRLQLQESGLRDSRTAVVIFPVCCIPIAKVFLSLCRRKRACSKMRPIRRIFACRSRSQPFRQDS